MNRRRKGKEPYSFVDRMRSLLLSFLLLPAAVAAAAAVAEYNETLALKLLHFAAATYGQRTGECVRSATGADSDWVVHLNTTMECDVFDQPCGILIAHSIKEKETIIAFRGTRGIAQFLSELAYSINPKMAFRTSENDTLGYINQYFLSAHLTTYHKVLDYLEDERFVGHKLSLTGHSLGGALAALAALRIVATGFRSSSDVRLYTFGEPRVGNAELARNMDKFVTESYRIVHSMDAVPHIPRCKKSGRFGHGNCIEGGYYHHGTEIWYPHTNKIGKENYKVCNGGPIGEDASCSNTVNFHNVFRAHKYFSDHGQYLGIELSDFGRGGCTVESGKPDERSILTKAKDKVVEEAIKFKNWIT
ncbi:hypothetical protein PRIPAC_82920, partial [Pristionchus pacificus]